MRSGLLKVFSCLAFAAAAFPFMFAIDTCTFKGMSAVRMLFYFGVGAVIFLIGYAEGAVSKAHRKLRIPLRIAGCLTFAGGFLALVIGGTGLTVFAFGSCCVFAFFLGERACYKNFADMFPLAALAFYIVLTIISYIYVRFGAPENMYETACDVVSVSFALEFTASALLVNQSGIFERANMRKETKSSLPGGLTSYNAALILGITVTTFALCVFRKQLAWLLEQICITLVKAYLALIEMFQPEPMEEEISGNGEIGMAGFWFEEYGWYFTQAFIILSLIVLAVIFRKKIFGAVKGFFIWLGALFGGRPEQSEQPEFTDVFEDYSKGRAKRPESDNVYAVRRKYKAEKDAVMKYRYGYRILLFGIKAVNGRLTAADTVTVQAERGSQRYGEAEMSAVAHVYDGIRYGSKIPGIDDLNELDRLVEK